MAARLTAALSLACDNPETHVAVVRAHRSGSAAIEQQGGRARRFFHRAYAVFLPYDDHRPETNRATY